MTRTPPEPRTAVECAMAAVHSGRLVDCTTAEYATVRDALHDQANKWLDLGDTVRAQISLSEVRRLDALHWGRKQ